MRCVLLIGRCAVEAVRAIRDGRSKALVCLGGNLAVAMSDPETTLPAMLDSLGYRELTPKAILAHTIGGLAAAFAAHWSYVLVSLI